MLPEGTFPPRPKRNPTVHLEGRWRKTPRTLKGDVGLLKEKISLSAKKWAEGQKRAEEAQKRVREDGKEVRTLIAEKTLEEKNLINDTMEPVYKTVEKVSTSFDSKNGKTRPYVTSFMISAIVSWVLGPRDLIALYELARYGTSSTDLGLMNGTGRWFRDTIGMARETDQVGSLVWAMVIGLTPMVILLSRNITAGYLAQGTYRGRLAESGIKWLTRSAYLIPIGYFVGVSYPEQVTWISGSPWTFQWWQFWVAGLFCTTFYCTMWVLDRIEKKLGLGYVHILLMTPLASVVTGLALYAPDAAW